MAFTWIFLCAIVFYTYGHANYAHDNTRRACDIIENYVRKDIKELEKQKKLETPIDLTKEQEILLRYYEMSKMRDTDRNLGDYIEDSSCYEDVEAVKKKRKSFREIDGKRKKLQ